MNQIIYIDGDSLTLEQIVQVSRKGTQIQLAEDAKHKINQSRTLVEKFLSEGRAIYGINTGFGKFSDVSISADQIEELQHNLIVADAVGVGSPFDTEIIRAMILLRINALAKGFSGIRLVVVQTLIDMLNKGVHPQVREKGSVGSSGDLCPLAHMVLPMLGLGEAEYQGEILEGKEAMQKAGIATVVLKAKEGLALINGTCAMTAVGSLAIYDAVMISKTADVIAMLTIEALEGITDAFDARIQLVRPHKGQIEVAKNLLKLCQNSQLTTRQGEKRMQDAYSLRCTPQIHGASRLALDYVKGVIETEINAATDNPLIFTEGEEAYSGGNFHGQPVAIAMDTLGIAMAEYANVSERRIERLVNPTLSEMPAFLVKEGGLNCGFMVPQYAAASLVSENKVLAHPASVDSIPTSANQEDHVSMGTIAARKARTIISHTCSVLGIEWLCGTQAVDFKNPELLGLGSSEAYRQLRQRVTFMESDRVIYKDMDVAYDLIASGKLIEAVETITGTLY
ncbi:MAG: histidine ammonia-lyase [Tissierellales bacterium]|nr:histidine ammonia-lyase [Tissierellales bacterium]MBN2828106.1 histidine ammonia-lyase [Tissierellales bacterium]